MGTGNFLLVLLVEVLLAEPDEHGWLTVHCCLVLASAERRFPMLPTFLKQFQNTRVFVFEFQECRMRYTKHSGALSGGCLYLAETPDCLEGLFVKGQGRWPSNQIALRLFIVGQTIVPVASFAIGPPHHIRRLANHMTGLFNNALWHGLAFRFLLGP